MRDPREPLGVPSGIASALAPPLRPVPFDLAAHPTGIAVERFEADPGLRAQGPRTRDHVMILYVAAGHGSVMQGPATFDAAPGSVFAAAPNEVHAAGGLGCARGWVMSFVPSALAQRLGPRDARLPRPGDPLWFVLVRTACLGQHHRVPACERGRWEDRFAALADELAGRAPGYEQAARALATLVVIALARLVAADPDDTARVAVQQDAVAEAFSYIEEHFHEPISLDDVAVGLSRSPAGLARLVRRWTGRSVNDWIAERRLTEARRLLLETDEPVEAIADQVGYGDAGWFRRRFKDSHGLSPRDWRELHRGRDPAAQERP